MEEELLYHELTRQVIGVSFTVHNMLGFGHREKVLQRAHEIEYEKLGLKFKKEAPVSIFYEGRIIAKYFMDFVIEDKVVVELKLANEFYTKDIKQVLCYLKANNLRLGLLIIFNKEGVSVKRIIN
jgi:GxxExxY protein